jgi:hypothetical protein
VIHFYDIDLSASLNNGPLSLQLGLFNIRYRMDVLVLHVKQKECFHTTVNVTLDVKRSRRLNLSRSVPSSKQLWVPLDHITAWNVGIVGSEFESMS